MGRIGLACRVFWLALSGKLTAERLAVALGEGPAAGELADERPARAVQPDAESRQTGRADGRSDALTLLATLQREARWVDLVQEPLGEYSDEQIGAAARDVLRDCRNVLQRLFDLQPVIDQPEDTDVETPAEVSSGRFRLTGAVSGEPPFAGKLVHSGWLASRCDLPQWTGTQDDQWIVAPVEIEVR